MPGTVVELTWPPHRQPCYTDTSPRSGLDWRPVLRAERGNIQYYVLRTLKAVFVGVTCGGSTCRKYCGTKMLDTESGNSVLRIPLLL
jgi:hypothetical protein